MSSNRSIYKPRRFPKHGHNFVFVKRVRRKINGVAFRVVIGNIFIIHITLYKVIHPCIGRGGQCAGRYKFSVQRFIPIIIGNLSHISAVKRGGVHAVGILLCECGVRVPAVEREVVFGCGGFLFCRRFGKRGERTRNLRCRAAAVRDIKRDVRLRHERIHGNVARYIALVKHIIRAASLVRVPVAEGIAVHGRFGGERYRAVVVGIDGRVLLPVARRAVFAHHKGDGVRFTAAAGGQSKQTDRAQHHERQKDRNSVLDLCHKNYSFYKIYFLAK